MIELAGARSSAIVAKLRARSRIFLASARDDRQSRETLITFAANLMLAAIGMATGIVAARLLGPEGRGRLAAIQAWPAFVGSIAMMGLPEAIVYLGAGNWHRLRRLASAAFIFCTISSIVAAVLLYFATPRLLAAYAQADIAAARMYSMWIVLGALTAMPIALIRARRRNVLWNLLRFLSPCMWLLVLIAAWFRQIHGAGTIATMFLIVSMATNVSVFAGSHVVLRWWATPALDETRSLLGFGSKVVLTSVPQMLNLRLDQLLMTILLPPAILGGYVVAVGWSSAFNVISAAFAAVLFPVVAEQATNGRQLILRTYKRSLVASSCAAGVFAIITPSAVPLLFGEPFRAIVPTTFVLIFATVISGGNAVLGEGLKGLGHPEAVLKAETGALLVTLTMLLALLPRWYALGAAASSLLAYATSSFLLLRHLYSIDSSTERRPL